MNLALIEVEAMAKKAARGAGYSWGMAEEAAKATRWLCAAGFDGVATLATVLQTVDGKNLSPMTPVTLGGEWQGSSDSLCPLAAGAALSDSTAFWADGGKTLSNVIAPLLLLPFAANAALNLKRLVTLSWQGAQLVTDGRNANASSEQSFPDQAETVQIQAGGTFTNPIPIRFRATPTNEDWATLERFAHRTYAPDTEESRLKGAGAGLSDND